MEDEDDREAKRPDREKLFHLNMNTHCSEILHTFPIIKDQNAIQRFRFSEKRIQIFAGIANLNEREETLKMRNAPGGIGKENDQE
jgi:hypothetical protein